jgi:hypothetical protein
LKESRFDGSTGAWATETGIGRDSGDVIPSSDVEILS